MAFLRIRAGAVPDFSLIVLLLLAGCGKERAPEEFSLPPGAPSAVLRVTRRLDAPHLDDAIGQYASQHGFRVCPVSQYTLYSGPGYPRVLYKGDRFAIWAWAQEPPGVFHTAPYNTNYTGQQFEQFTNSLVAAVGRYLHVQLNPTDHSK